MFVVIYMQTFVQSTHAAYQLRTNESIGFKCKSYNKEYYVRDKHIASTETLFFNGSICLLKRHA